MGRAVTCLPTPNISPLSIQNSFSKSDLFWTGFDDTEELCAYEHAPSVGHWFPPQSPHFWMIA